MTQSDKNKLFDFFREKHDLLLTGAEIEEIIKKIDKDNDKHYLRLVQNKINTYRFINVVLLSFLNFILPLIFPSIAITTVVWLFIIYNLVHLLINSIKDRKDARKQYRMARKQ